MKNTSPFSIWKNKSFDLSHGFLPSSDPIESLSDHFYNWETFVHILPKLFLSETFRQDVLSLPDFDVNALKTEAEFERAMLILSYLGHAYVWHGKPSDRLPAKLAQPWMKVADHIGRPPILSYASYALYNWKRLDKEKPIECGNIALLQNFLGGIDEEWFIIIHVDIEEKASQGLKAIWTSLAAVKSNEIESLTQALEKIAESLHSMCEVLDRMPEHCDPYIYFNRVRPYIHGWKDNPALPNGVIYEGVNEAPLFFKGETGAQSSIIPCFDALLGIQHANNFLKKHLDEMQSYMPPSHRRFLEMLQKEGNIREVIVKNKSHEPLRKSYNTCLEMISRFRKTHVGYAAHYIQKQHQQSLANPTSVGTGGTPFMDYLKSHLNETEAHFI